MKISHLTKSIAVAACMAALAACQTTSGSEAGNSSATTMVVKKMAEGNVAAICKGGRDQIARAAREAVTELAQNSMVSGDYEAIGKAAGAEFQNKQCA
jgi:hypothetical protein